MKKVLFLAVKEMRVLLSNKGNVFFVFGFPVIFALFFGTIFSSSGEGPTGMKIAVVDEDNSDFSASYISRLQSNEALNIITPDRDRAIEQVRKGNISAAVIIKKGFGDGFDAMFNSEESKLEIAADPSRRMEGGYLQGILAKAQFEALSDKFTDKNWMRRQIQLWRDDVEDANGLDVKQSNLFLDLFNSLDNLVADSNSEIYEAGFDGEILNFSQINVNREYEGPVTSFQITFPQAMLWGIFSCAATFAISIVKERSGGTFQRLLVGPVGRAHILAGKGTACFATCIVIICILYISARLIFKMPIGNQLLFVLASLCTILCFVGLMMFICTLGRTEESAGSAGWAMLMIMAMLGGGMVPLAFMPVWMRPFSHISPVKWGIYALEGAIWRNLSFVEMTKPLVILLAIGATAFMFGISMLRRQDK